MKKLLLYCVLLSVIVLSLLAGRYGYPSSEIFVKYRLPKTLIAFAVGFVLASSGAMYQSVLNNPLADPYILGTASFSALFTSIGMIIGVSYIFYPLFGFMGALFSVFLILLFIKFKGRGAYNILIYGVMLNIMAGAVITALFFFSGESVKYIITVLMGYINIFPFIKYPILYVFLFFIFFMIFYFSIKWGDRFDIVSMGDMYSYSLGVNPATFRIKVFILVSLSVGFVVSFAGIVGFIGFVSPHIVRMYGIKRYKKMIITAGWIGGGLLVLSDFIGRNIWYSEIPSGIIATIIGVPFFIYVMFNGKRLWNVE